jgi:hypothetical protein
MTGHEDDNKQPRAAPTPTPKDAPRSSWDPLPVTLDEAVETSGLTRNLLLRAGLSGELRLGWRPSGLRGFDTSPDVRGEFLVPIDEFVLLHQTALRDLLVGDETPVQMVGILDGDEATWMRLESTARLRTCQVLIPEDEWKTWLSEHARPERGEGDQGRDGEAAAFAGVSGQPEPLSSPGPDARRRERATLGLVLRAWAASGHPARHGTYAAPNQSRLAETVVKQLEKALPESPLPPGYSDSSLRGRFRAGLADTAPDRIEEVLVEVMGLALGASNDLLPKDDGGE